MRLHYLQHVPFEDLANIEVWARNKGHRISQTRFFANEPLPPVEAFDWLVVLGGPMNIYEEDRYPWLADEKRFIAQAVERKKVVLGICLGAQLLADVLGGKVVKNAHKEIGWFPVSLTGEGQRSAVTRNLPQRFPAFHWHGDTFHLPTGCERLAESEACANQAFAYQGRAVGLQF
ncbi:MAG: type 1 glutamine amidotransferase, partial [Nitrospinae bacterium]|nr:type 1 glutamine amidotransferase [Nitrospinota bacterium]